MSKRQLKHQPPTSRAISSESWLKKASQLQIANHVWILDCKEDNFPIIIIMSDRKHFHLRGFVNNQNYRFWSSTNPYVIHEESLHSLKVTVWCSVYWRDIGTACAITAECCKTVIDEFLLPQINEEYVIRAGWCNGSHSTFYSKLFRALNLSF